MKLLKLFTTGILAFFISSIYADLPPSNLPLQNFSTEQLEQAATAGDPDAQYALGYMYYYGKGISKDPSVGQDWIKRAAVQGQDQAIQAMRVMGKKVAVNANPLEEGTPTKVSDDMNVSDNPAASAKPAIEKATQPVIAAKASQPADTTVVAQNQAASVSAEAPSKAVDSSKSHPAENHYYTIQLMESKSLTKVQNYLKVHHLQGKANYVTTQRAGKNWYSVTYGKYPTLAAAKAGVKGLPASVKAQKPRVVGKSDA